MAALIAGARSAGVTGQTDRSGLSPARTGGPAAADRSPVAVRPGRTTRSWPLLVLAAPAAAEVWSGWVGIAAKTGFGRVPLLPGLWPALHLDTAITLPVGVEDYAAYALRAWLASGQTVSPRTRRFAKWSAIFSFALGMAGQVTYHLLATAARERRHGTLAARITHADVSSARARPKPGRAGIRPAPAAARQRPPNEVGPT
jgi:hypothetical protein